MVQKGRGGKEPESLGRVGLSTGYSPSQPHSCPLGSTSLLAFLLQGHIKLLLCHNTSSRLYDSTRGSLAVVPLGTEQHGLSLTLCRALFKCHLLRDFLTTLSSYSPPPLCHLTQFYFSSQNISPPDVIFPVHCQVSSMRAEENAGHRAGALYVFEE